MNNRLIVMLAVVTALVAGAAVMSLKQSAEQRLASGGGSEVGAPMFPGLAGRVNEAVVVAVESKDGSFTLAKLEDGWGLQTKGGYPVDFDKVKALVVGLAELVVLEQKTSTPAYYAKLGVEDVGPTAESTRVTISDAAGAVLADAIVGHARTSRTRGAGGASLYVREHGAAASFEVTGQLAIDAQPSNWLDKQIIKLDKQRVRRVEIRHPDGETLIVERQDEADAHFTARDLPAEREVMWEGVADSIGGALGWANLEDVGPALVDFDEHEVTTATFTCFDGYVVTAETVEVDEQTFLRLRGTLDAVQRADAVEVGPTPDSEGGEPDEPDESGEAGADEETGLTADEVQAEAEALNVKVGEWIYEIPGYRAGDLRKHMDDLLKPLESEQPDAAPGSDTPTGLPPEVLKQLQDQGLMDADGNLIPQGDPAPAEEPR